MKLTIWNHILYILPVSVAQCVWTPSTFLPPMAPTLIEFFPHQTAALLVFDFEYFAWHVLHHRVRWLYRNVHGRLVVLKCRTFPNVCLSDETRETVAGISVKMSWNALVLSVLCRHCGRTRVNEWMYWLSVRCQRLVSYGRTGVDGSKPLHHSTEMWNIVERLSVTNICPHVIFLRYSLYCLVSFVNWFTKRKS